MGTSLSRSMPSLDRAHAHLIALALLSTLTISCKRSEPVPSPDPPAPAPAIPTASALASALAVPSSAPSSASAPAPITDAQAALVWQAGGAGFKTVWVEPGASGVVIKRERNEPVIATRRSLFALRITHGTAATLDAVPLGGGASIKLASATVER